MKGNAGWQKTLGLTNWPVLRKTLVALLGGLILLVGLVLIVLPGPAFLVLPLGLAILASEFVWARGLVRLGKKLWAKTRGWRRKIGVVRQ
ncbi:MAG: PGPGW domain-containing protein [Chthoniobacterales bacterium]|nr:PGPGW domain-containing protein [Chthoniobacterales bacterium]